LGSNIGIFNSENSDMNKCEVVELESSFLKFCKKAHDLGFKFAVLQSLELQHNSSSPHNVGTRVKLNPDDFLNEN
jgi:hypothetical protein